VASRMSLSSGKLESSILVLTDLMNETSNNSFKEYLKKRVITLQIIGYLENAVGTYKNKYGKLPNNLDELVDIQLVKKIPTDPYGGNFFLTKDGRVYTTSKLVPVVESEEKSPSNNEAKPDNMIFVQ
jgi:hypothetical protein